MIYERAQLSAENRIRELEQLERWRKNTANKLE
jgi:hypothetical protein